MKFSVNLLALIFAATSLTAVHAQTETSTTERLFSRCDRDNFVECLNGVSNAVTSFSGARVLTQRGTQTVLRKAAVRSGLRSNGNALAAGDAVGSHLSWWGNYNHNDYGSDFLNELSESLNYDANIDSGMVGAQYMFGDRVLAGAAIGYEDHRTVTRFNGGGAKSEGLSVTPYVAILLNDNFSLDISGGYTTLDFKQTRISPVNGSTISADFDGERWFAAATLAAYNNFGDWNVGASLGVLRVAETQDGYSETGTTGTPVRTNIASRKIRLSQFIAGVDLSYAAAERFVPYAYANYRYDFSRNQGLAAGGLPSVIGAIFPDDRDEIELGLGTRFLIQDDLTASLEGNYVAGRAAFDSWSISATMRYTY